jgi:hypothetical protein
MVDVVSSMVVGRGLGVVGVVAFVFVVVGVVVGAVVVVSLVDGCWLFGVVVGVALRACVARIRRNRAANDLI